MSQHRLEQDPDEPPRRRSKRGLGCLAVLVALAVIAAGGYFVVDQGMHALKDAFGASAPDYSGTGTGTVTVEVKEGDNASDIADTLLAKDVIKSRQAFTEAANAEPKSRGIQVGFYKMQRKMSAEAALGVLIDPANVSKDTVAIPEGWTVDQIVKALADKTDFSAKQYAAVLAHPAKLGLPDYAGGDPEGYLFPATYEIRPDATPRSILTMMVDRFKQAAEDVDLEAGAADLGYSPHDVMVVASLIQAEARFDKDFSKVSRVIYNRLDQDMPLQFDSTVHYAVGRDGKVGTSDSDREVDSPYNTYKYGGLPPTPIMAPGEKAMRAALEPADGSWLYFVTTNPDTGETKFATTYAEHLRNKAEFDAWCAQSDNC